MKARPPGDLDILASPLTRARPETIRRRNSGRRGSVMALPLLALVLIALALLGSYAYRIQALRSQVARCGREIRARYLAESAKELALEAMERGAAARCVRFDLEGGDGAFLIGGARMSGTRFTRDVLVFGRVERTRAILFFSVVVDAARVPGAPELGRLCVESLWSLSASDLTIPDGSLVESQAGSLLEAAAQLARKLERESAGAVTP